MQASRWGYFQFARSLIGLIRFFSYHETMRQHRSAFCYVNFDMLSWRLIQKTSAQLLYAA
jgi:hypothetical protein